MEFVKTLICWQICDISPELILACETMAKLICRASKLKSDSYLFRNDPSNRPYCDMCHDFAVENVEHLLIHCPYFNDDRISMFKEMVELEGNLLP